jgi:Zn finger protein HypA/HybF involved in hydrogenase expression
MCNYGWSNGLDSANDNRIRSKYKYIALCENSNIHRGVLRNKIIKEGLILYKCSECGIINEWNGKKLVLELDHISGDSSDNRIENLRFLCPNCHSQTPTFKGRNKPKSEKEIKIIKERKKKERRKKIKNKKCNNCSKMCSFNADVCRDCYKILQRKYDRPDDQILLRQVKEFGYTKTSKIYGVSDKTIKKWFEDLSDTPNE